MRIIAAAALTLALAGCGSGQAVRLPTQTWQGTDVAVEVRPAPLHAGPAEFLIIATAADSGPANDLVISIRTHPDDAWQQAMQDGRMGVYRRSLPLAHGQQTLYVQIRRRFEQAVLEYPIEVE